MSKGFYSKIALQGIKKNKRLYFSYILTGIVMVMMVYIIFFLSGLEALHHMKGGGALRLILPLGGNIVSVFSLLFMFYSNSFITRQRNKEFGLYNILGMDKGNLRKVAIWECIYVGSFSLAVGLILGIVFSKTAELIMFNLLTESITYTLRIDFSAVAKTVLIFVGIYLILLINSIIKVSRSSPLELLHSADVGEKPPKANWPIAVIGVIILAAAYYIALSIKQPLIAFVWFMIAVIMVIIATYLLFISGSVAFCRLLQKSKKFYYKQNHFVSVSSMVYRMKRNGAGLASICVLITMVLVMLSSTFSLYIGAEDSYNSRHPKDIQLSIYISETENLNEEAFSEMRGVIDILVPEKEDVTEYAAVEIAGLFSESGITVDQSSIDDFDMSTYDKVGYLLIFPLDDYNRIMGANETLDDDECFIHCYRTQCSADTFTIENCAPLKVKKVLDEMYISGYTAMQTVPTITLVTKDINSLIMPISSMSNRNGDSVAQSFWSCNFNVPGSPESEIEVWNTIKNNMNDIVYRDSDGGYRYYLESKEESRDYFFGMYAGLLFVGVLLSIVFLFAAVLIIYYKQISEGYEDQKRFEVMQKVGMTKKNIRKSVNSQVLTVFFMPLLLAGLHLSFAFPILWKLLQLLSFRNLGLMIAVTAVCFAAFALIYAMVYKITSNTYYALVSDIKIHKGTG